MGKKLSLYLFLFILLIGINFYLGVLGLFQYKRVLQARKILNEINRPSSLNSQFFFSAAPLVMGAFDAKTKVVDRRTANLKAFIRKYYSQSPLYDYADLIVKISDKYQFDYRLLVAIAMQESNLCKRIPENSNNCWGWGIYGNNLTRFSSYEEAIKTVAKGIRKNYIDKGLVTPSAIMAKYTPRSKGSWAKGVTRFFKLLE